MIFNKKDVEVNFKSIPDGADVYVDGEKVGKTPVITRIRPSKDYVILYIKDGYANREFKIKKLLAMQH
jgi:diacylglycerol kinase family enzyme